MKRNLVLAYTILLFIFFFDNECFSVTDHGGIVSEDQFEATDSLKAISLHPFFGNGLNISQDIVQNRSTMHYLVEDGSYQDFLAVTSNLIYSHINHNLVKAVLRDDPLLVQGRRGVKSLTFSFRFGDKDLCQGEVRGHLLKSGHPVILGHIPQIDSDNEVLSAQDWPELEQTLKHIENSQNPNDKKSFKVIKSRSCYFLERGSLHPVWEVRIRLNGLDHLVRANEFEIFSRYKLYLRLQNSAVVGSVQAFESNPDETDLKIYSPKLVGDQTLHSDFFITESVGVDRAQSSDHVFVFQPEDDRFDESSVFIHATNMLGFFGDLGYQWKLDSPMPLVVHAVVKGANGQKDENNALYQSSGVPGELPKIFIGDGDGTILENLSQDADVVRHEFVHHVLFDTLKSVDLESLVLHEGYADYYPMAIDDNPCFGNSICPQNSNACFIKGQCLRTANNRLTYNSAAYSQLPAHLQGQVVSGLLWDLRTELGHEYTTRLAFQAASYFQSRSGFGDWMITLLMADFQINSGQNACAIEQAATKRGFEPFFDNVDCHSIADLTLEDSVQSADYEPTVVSTKSSDRQCGFFMAGDPVSEAAAKLPMILFLLFPFCILLIRFKLDE